MSRKDFSKSGRSVTSHDVARLAGVSQPTVSRALRNLPGTSAEVRRRVREAAESLSYIPSASGRTLSTQQTRRVAIIAEELTNPFYPELVEPVRRELAHHDLRTVLVTDTVSVDALADGSYDGVIITTVQRRSSLPRDLTERGVPHVLLNRTLDELESSSCSFDNTGGAKQLADLLADLGHHDVGMIQGPTGVSTGRERALGMREGLKERGIGVRREQVRRVSYSYADGFTAAIDLLDRTHRPTALVCANDVVAIGALAAASELGISIPDELTVVGFDDIPMASWGMIQLTTVRCDLDALATDGVDLLMKSMGANHTPVHHRLATELVPRATHGPAI